MAEIKSVSIKHFKGLTNLTVGNFGKVNVFVGKNNAGKSSILHAIHIACLAIRFNTWSRFNFKHAWEDIINDAGAFEISITYDDNHVTSVKAVQGDLARSEPTGRDENHIPIPLYLVPDIATAMLRRKPKSPNQTYHSLVDGQFTEINAIEILYALKYFAEKNEQGLEISTYNDLINELKSFFPDITEFVSSMDADNVPRLKYIESGKTIDVLYSGMGLKQFLDVIVKIALSKAEIIVIDEPETGLHPDIQRKFFDYLDRFAREKGVQFFISTHSPVVLNFSEEFKFYRVLNRNGNREVKMVDASALETTLGDLGIRPSDLFNHDLCLMVEGQSEVVFFEHIIRVLYKEDFKEVAVAIVQYGGGNVDAIKGGAINLSNIVPAQRYVFWTRDRDARPTDVPSGDSNSFKAAVEQAGMPCHIWQKREIEYYYPDVVHLRAQQNSDVKEAATIAIFMGDQSQKYREAAKVVTPNAVCVPTGIYLRKLLRTNMTSKTQIHDDIVPVLTQLLSWKGEILGDT